MTQATEATTVTSLDELCALVAGSTAPLYVRWSRGPEADRAMGRSINHATGLAEAGISTNPLHSETPAIWPNGHAGYVAMEIAEYQHLGHPVCYVLTGELVCRGSDREAIVDAETLTPIAIIDPAVVADAAGVDRMTGSRCRHEGTLDVYTTATYCRACGAKVA